MARILEGTARALFCGSLSLKMEITQLFLLSGSASAHLIVFTRSGRDPMWELGREPMRQRVGAREGTYAAEGGSQGGNLCRQRVGAREGTYAAEGGSQGGNLCSRGWEPGREPMQQRVGAREGTYAAEGGSQGGNLGWEPGREPRVGAREGT